MSNCIRSLILLALACFLSSAASGAISLPASYNSNSAAYGPPAAQFFSACTNANALNGAPLTGHVSWIWSTGGGGAAYCLYLSNQSQIGRAGSGGTGYAVGDIITLSATDGNTTGQAKAVVTAVSSGLRSVRSFSFQGAGSSGGIFYAPFPTSFVQASTTGRGTGFKLAQPRYQLPVVVSPVPNVNSGGYWPLTLDNGNLSNCDILCWRAKHPDWIAYDCDQKTPAFYQRTVFSNVSAVSGSRNLVLTPAEAAQISVGMGVINESNGAYLGGIIAINDATGVVTLDMKFSGTSAKYPMVFAKMGAVPLNWTNPAVQAYYVGWITAYFKGGSGTNFSGSAIQLDPNFNSIDFDLVNLNNTLGVCGYYAGAKPGVGTAPSYGGKWTPLFSGALFDEMFTKALTGFACSLSATTHKLATPTPFVAANIAGVANNGTVTADFQAMAACFDVWVDEASFFSCKDGRSDVKILTGPGFARAVATIQTTLATVGWGNVSYLCQSAGKPAAQLTTFEAAGQVWSSAVYYLLQAAPTNRPSYMGMVGYTVRDPLDHARYVPYDPSWFPQIGSPVDQAHLNAGGCYERHYTTGLVELNAGTTACRFTVPANAKDQFGNAVTSGILQPVPADATTIACSTPTTQVSTCNAIVISTK